MINWQCSCAPITSCVDTLTDWFSQCNVKAVGALVATFQVPGPTSGTSATAKDGVNWPVSTPLDALSAGAFATDLTFEAVPLEELFS
jgi:hypothetical protein